MCKIWKKNSSLWLFFVEKEIYDGRFACRADMPQTSMV